VAFAAEAVAAVVRNATTRRLCADVVVVIVVVAPLLHHHYHHCHLDAASCCRKSLGSRTTMAVDVQTPQKISKDPIGIRRKDHLVVGHDDVIRYDLRARRARRKILLHAVRFRPPQKICGPRANHTFHTNWFRPKLQQHAAPLRLIVGPTLDVCPFASGRYSRWCGLLALGVLYLYPKNHANHQLILVYSICKARRGTGSI
jgi:hypothetical protein